MKKRKQNRKNNIITCCWAASGRPIPESPACRSEDAPRRSGYRGSQQADVPPQKKKQADVRAAPPIPPPQRKKERISYRAGPTRPDFTSRSIPTLPSHLRLRCGRPRHFFLSKRELPFFLSLSLSAPPARRPLDVSLYLSPSHPPSSPETFLPAAGFLTLPASSWSRTAREGRRSAPRLLVSSIFIFFRLCEVCFTRIY